MTELLFYTRFKSQLRRTQPDLVSQIEKTVIRAITDAGGKITGERQLLIAIFNENSIGFWLDIRLLLENLKKELDSKENLYGYALVLSQEHLEAPEQLSRVLSGGDGGIFLDNAAVKGIFPYVHMEEPEQWLEGRNIKHHKANHFYKLKGFKTFIPAIKKNSNLLGNINRLLTQEPMRNVLILGPAFSNKRESLRQYCRSVNSDFPVLTICFGRGGLNALIDSWSSRIRVLSEGAAVEKIDGLWEELFKERLRDEVTPFFARKTLAFFSQLLEFYLEAAKTHKRTPILLLENIHLAEKTAEEMLLGIFAGLQNESVNSFFVLGTCEESISIEDLRKWENIFKRIIKTEAVKQDVINLFSLPPELLEIAYALSLFGNYYPVDLLQVLLEEEGKNPSMISRALSFLTTMGVIENTFDARPRLEGFVSKAELILGKSTGRIKSMVARRLLNWVQRRKLNPCFKFLVIIKELDPAIEISEQLIVESIVSDLHSKTYTSLLFADRSGQLQNIVGDEKTESIRYILQTMRFLLFGNEQDIRNAFKTVMPNCDSFPVLKTQALANHSSYYLGLRNKNAAQETIKEGIMLSQNENDYCLPQLYRLFSFVHLSKQQASEAIDYLGFAMSNAEKSGNYYELCVSVYYAAASQFLFGNLSKAIFLARKAVEHSIKAGRPGWVDRSRFLEGRLAFEIGSYNEALDIFEDLRRNPLDRISVEKEQVLAAWHYRTMVYLGNPLTPKPVSGGSDTAVFELEAAYLAGNYEKCAELSATIDNTCVEDHFQFTEQPDWRTGFAQCELLYFPYGEIRKRIISTYQSLALCCLSNRGKEEAIHNMQNIIRKDWFSELDPWDVFCYYAWYKIMEYTQASQVDISTAVSGAFKRLQRRSSRIENVETRRLYLNQPRWNRALSQVAKEFKLI